MKERQELLLHADVGALNCGAVAVAIIGGRKLRSGWRRASSQELIECRTCGTISYKAGYCAHWSWGVLPETYSPHQQLKADWILWKAVPEHVVAHLQNCP